MTYVRKHENWIAEYLFDITIYHKNENLKTIVRHEIVEKRRFKIYFVLSVGVLLTLLPSLIVVST